MADGSTAVGEKGFASSEHAKRNTREALAHRRLAAKGQTLAVCGNCVFFTEDALGGQQCRRRAPRLVKLPDKVGGAMISMWPPTEAGEWCGEWALP